MIIGERFAWGHLPKTGGDATHHLFSIFPDLVLYSDPRFSNDKHTPFPVREASIHGKALVLNIRRLPSWLLSYSNHKARRGLFPNYEPTAMPSVQEIAESTVADETLAIFTDFGRFHIDYWLRMESLTSDFLAFIGRFSEIPQAQLEHIADLGQVNASTYDHDVDHWFTGEQIATMYRLNPIWCEVERFIYGDCMSGLPSARAIRSQDEPKMKPGFRSSP